MKLIITTTYEHFDEDWLEMYLNRLAGAAVLPGSMNIVDDLRKNHVAVFKSADPDSETTAEIKYELYK